MDKYTIKQAALALGISTQTVRRRIAKGELTAEKETTDFGEMWFIPASAIQYATHTVEVVSLTRKVTPAEISQLVAAQVEPLRVEIALLREEIANQTKALEASAGRDSAPLRESFFQRLFGGRQERERKNDQS